MRNPIARANVDPVRQRTQYTCMATSMMMALRALGFDVYEDEVNKVVGAKALRGAAWEQALATAQYYGVRGTLVTPSTVPQLKEWTDRGLPVLIAWNPEGRDWSHCSVVFDVDDELNVHVADPNIPDPAETVRVVPKAEFYKMWVEKWPKYLVRRPALMLEREVTPQGKQVMASRVAIFSIHPGLKDMARKMKAILDEYGIMGAKVKPFNSGYEGVRIELPAGNPTRNITYYDQPGKVGPEDQTGAYISLEVDRKLAFKKKHPANRYGDVQFSKSEKARINKEVLEVFTEIVAEALAPDNVFEFRRARKLPSNDELMEWWDYSDPGTIRRLSRKLMVNPNAEKWNARMWEAVMNYYVQVEMADPTGYVRSRITAASRPSKEELDAAKDVKWQDWEVQKLPYDLFKYFKKAPGAIEVDVSDLTPIRAREKGVANANRFMWLAYHGAMERRKPVSLQDNGDGTYTVLDGNSTFANAKKNGWKKLYGKVEKVKSAHLKEAAKKDLQALDFVAGLIRQFDRRDQYVSEEVNNATLLRRVIALRKEVQKGFDLSLLARNTDVLRGNGKKIVKKIEKIQDIVALMSPTGNVLKAFQKTYGDKEKGARKIQAAFCRKLIKSKLRKEIALLSQEGARVARSPEISDAQLDDLVMNSRAFFNEAFAVVNKYAAQQMSKVSGALSGSPGTFQIRSKAEQSTWDKSVHRKKVPFYSLGDLVGCRSITDSLKGMMEACEEAQAKIDVVAKENKFGGYGGYNAVHYALLFDKIVVEYQIKAKVNKLEAGISHDLVLSDEKFRDRFQIDPLPQAQKDLVIRVINISTQMSMRDFADMVEGLDVSGDRMDSLLYGDAENSEDEVVDSLTTWEDAEGTRRLAQILVREGLIGDTNG